MQSKRVKTYELCDHMRTSGDRQQDLGRVLSFESQSLPSVEWGSTLFLRSVMDASDLQDP